MFEALPHYVHDVIHVRPKSNNDKKHCDRYIPLFD